MALDVDTARRLFFEGNLVRLIERAGSTQAERLALEPFTRALVAEALAEAGDLDEAIHFADTKTHTALPASVRAQMEWIRGLVSWRQGAVSAAINYARSALRVALESGDSHQIVWSHLHIFRVLILTEPLDAIRITLSDVRRVVNGAGFVQATAYLHNTVALLEGQRGHLDEARRHLDIAESLLRLAPNSLLLGRIYVNRGNIAATQCDLERSIEYCRAATDIAAKSTQQTRIGADTTLGYVEFQAGHFDSAKQTLADVLNSPKASAFSQLIATDTLARVYLALGSLHECDEALKLIER